MSDYVQATLDAIALLQGIRSLTKIDMNTGAVDGFKAIIQMDNNVAQRCVDNAVYWLETDLRNYLTGRS